MTKATPETARQVDLVRQHPETVEITLGGRKMLFLLNGKGLKMAVARGEDPLPAVFRLISRVIPIFEGSAGGFSARALSQLANTVTSELFDELAIIIWWGLLSAQPDVERDEIEILLSIGTIKSLLEQVLPKVLEQADDVQAESKAAKAEASGNGKEGN